MSSRLRVEPFTRAYPLNVLTMLLVIVSNCYRDPSEIKISKAHTYDSAGWRRPRELLERAPTHDAHRGADIVNEEPTMLALADIDLVQDVTADCSVVASLCAAVARPGSTYGKV